MFLRRFICLSLAALLLVSSVVPLQAKETVPAEQKETAADTYKWLQLFGDVFERVRQDYVDEVKDKDLIEYAINGMLTSLDPHSSYLNDEGFEDIKVQTRGSFGGLGIEVTMEEGLVKVISPIDETPAARAGVKAGDFITHLDGKPVMGLSLNEAVDKMRGKVGMPIEITIRREGISQPIELKVVRDVIKVESVRFSRYDNVGYIRITSFNQLTYPGLKKALEDLPKGEPKLAAYVLDLRNNPGGLLDQAIAVSDAFLDKGEIVSTRGRKEEDTKRDNASKGDESNRLPLIVLINGGSASAAEIVAGALQDNRRGLVLGTKSFGKGSVQTIISLPNNAALRLTTARYYTPSGRSIQAKGIEPDIFVEQGKLQTEKELDAYKISEADLKGALDGQAGKKHEDGTKAVVPAVVVGAPTDETKDKEAEDKKTINPSHPDLEKDYQLGRAIDMARGLSLYQSQIPPQGTPTADEAMKKADTSGRDLEPGISEQKGSADDKADPAKADPKP